jgi:hypothetical protein
MTTIDATRQDEHRARTAVRQRAEALLKRKDEAIPAISEQKHLIRAQRLGSQQFLLDTAKFASPYEKSRFSGASPEPEAARLEIDDEYTKERVAYVLGLDGDTMERDSWSIHELFEIFEAERQSFVSTRCTSVFLVADSNRLPGSHYPREGQRPLSENDKLGPRPKRQR